MAVRGFPPYGFPPGLDGMILSPCAVANGWYDSDAALGLDGTIPSLAVCTAVASADPGSNGTISSRVDQMQNGLHIVEADGRVQLWQFVDFLRMDFLRAWMA